MFLAEAPSQKLVSQSPAVAAAATQEDEKPEPESGWLAKLLIPIPLGGSLHTLGTTEKMIMAARAGLSGVVMLLAILTVYMGLLTVF